MFKFFFKKYFHKIIRFILIIFNLLILILILNYIYTINTLYFKYYFNSFNIITFQKNKYIFENSKNSIENYYLFSIKYKLTNYETLLIYLSNKIIQLIMCLILFWIKMNLLFEYQIQFYIFFLTCYKLILFNKLFLFYFSFYFLIFIYLYIIYRYIKFTQRKIKKKKKFKPIIKLLKIKKNKNAIFFKEYKKEINKKKKKKYMNFFHHSPNKLKKKINKYT